ncbi:MAG: hypothetical protein QOJ06_2589 [Pseudonocardiales bacterium]|jgi:hypothetical protein|nr:hypothetical protein [Pseudonocardiales bacterium]
MFRDFVVNIIAGIALLALSFLSRVDTHSLDSVRAPLDVYGVAQ